MKVLIRACIALFGAVFGSLVASVSTCSYAASRSPWPHWADFVCGHNVWALWLVTAPLFFAVTALLLGRHVIRFRRHMVVVLLVMYGLHGTVHLVSINAWSMALLPVATLVAAGGVALVEQLPKLPAAIRALNTEAHKYRFVAHQLGGDTVRTKRRVNGRELLRLVDENRVGENVVYRTWSGSTE